MPVCELYECFSEILGFSLQTLFVAVMLGMWTLAAVLLLVGRWLK